MSSKIHREITPLKENDCFLIFDRERQGFSFPIHFHPEYEINYISNAKGAKRIVGDHIGEIQEKELVMTGPNLHHSWENYKYDTNQTLHEITIQFPRELFEDSLLDKNILNPIKELLDNSHRGILFSQETIKSVEGKIIELSKKRGFDSFLLFLSILYDLSTSRDQQSLTNVSFQRQSDFHNSEKIEIVYNYIKDNCNTKIKVTDAAKLVNLSITAFSRLIKQSTGKSFVEFVNEIRLGNATRLLIETNKTISEVCFECGFNNLSNFNRSFKKIQGCTPTEFRDNFTGIRNVL